MKYIRRFNVREFVTRPGIMRSYIHVLLIVNERRHPSVSIFPIGHLAAEVPQSSVQEPRWFQVGSVDQVVATFRMEANPLAVDR